MRNERGTIKLLLKNSDNRRWYFKNWSVKLFSYFTAFVSVWTVLDAFNINFTDIIENILPGSSLIVICLAALICALITNRQCTKELTNYSQIRVETERAGCSVEIRVADSYLTNAFDNYPHCSMIIGLNKAFWFQEAEPGSLVADMWKRLEEKGVSRENVQRQIDQALQALWTKDGKPDMALKAKYIDQSRPKVYVKCTGNRPQHQPCAPGCSFSCPIKQDDKEGLAWTECRDNYKIGTVVGIDLHLSESDRQVMQSIWKLLPAAFRSRMKRTSFNITAATNKLLRIRPPEGKQSSAVKPLGFFSYLRKNRYKKITGRKMVKKLYLIANSEVVQGFDITEPMKVTFDRNASVVENFPKIWEFFEAEEEKTPMPPKHIVYQPLLMPLIGAGVANEGYSDLEIFSKIVDLYYDHLRKSIRAGKHPVIPNLIINIQSKTAIEISGENNSRKIDLKTAFDYLKYRNKVNPVVSRE